MSYYNNINMSNICFVLDEASKVLQSKTEEGTALHLFAREIKTKWLQQQLKSIHSVNDLKNAVYMKHITSSFSALEPLFAFDALTGGRREQELYQAISMFGGFTPIDSKITRPELEASVIDYLCERADRRDEIDHAIKEHKFLGSICQYAVHILKDDRLFEEQYGHDFTLLPITTSRAMIDMNMPMKSRLYYFNPTKKTTLARLQAEFPNYAIIENTIKFDLQYLGPKLKCEFNRRHTMKQASTIKSHLGKLPPAAPLKRRPK